MAWQITTGSLVSKSVFCNVMVLLSWVLILCVMGLFIVQTVAPSVVTQPAKYLYFWAPVKGGWMNGERAEHCLCSWDGYEEEETWQMSREDDEDEQPGKAGKEKEAFPGFFPMEEIWKHSYFHVLMKNKLKEFSACPLLYMYLIIVCTFSCNKPAKAQPGRPACLPEDEAACSFLHFCI